MPQLQLSNVNKFYGRFQALRDIDLSIERGQFVVLIGPSGCGKSTLLRSIAGLEDISSGDIRIADVTVNDTPPRLRDVAMVFQSYALYPHMDVTDNMTYSLRLRRRPASVVQAALGGAAGILGLSELLKRYPRELSGGQRQRVAMGRAIVRDPKLFLFDEPLSNLDAELRVRMRAEVRGLHERLGATSVYVTHDQIEAMTMADHVVVLKDGRIEQQGPPLDLYDFPVNRFVASFIGSPAMNFLRGEITPDGRAVHWQGLEQPLPTGRDVAGKKPVTVGLRPEHLRIAAENEPAPIRASVATVEATGAQAFVHTEHAGQQLSFLQQGRTSLQRADAVALTIDPLLIHLFDVETGTAI